MSNTGLRALDRSVHQLNDLLKAIETNLHTEDRNEAYLALRGTLHALRDQLEMHEAVHLSQQLPLIARGIFFDGWVPERTGESDEAAFFSTVRDTFPSGNVSPQRMATAVFEALSETVTEGQLNHVISQLPKAVRELWPETVRS